MTTNEIRELYDYTEWANNLALDAAEKLSAEQISKDVGISHKSILGTLAHTAAADWIWLERWQGRSPMGDDVWEAWTPPHLKDIKAVREKWTPIMEARWAYLEKLTDAELPKELSFRRVNGDAGSMPLVQQLQHVVNHSTLHRGQVVGMIRQFGVVPPTTDLLFYWMGKKK